MNSRILKSFLLAFFMLAVVVLTVYASNIFTFSKKATSVSSKQIDCSSINLRIDYKASFYDKQDDALNLLVQNKGPSELKGPLIVKVGSKKRVFNLSLSPSEFSLIKLKNFSTLSKGSSISTFIMYIENCSDYPLRVDANKILNSK